MLSSTNVVCSLLEEVITDDQMESTCSVFKTFIKRNWVKHILMPSYHTDTKKTAERPIQLFKLTHEKQVLQREITYQCFMVW